MIKVIVFDFDGVLVDSNRIKHDAWYDVFGDLPEEEKRVAFEVFPKVEVRTRYVILDEVFKALGRPEDKRKELVQINAAKYNAITQAGISRYGLIEGARELLEDFSKKYHLYLNSSTPIEALNETVDMLGIRGFFSGIYGRPDTKESALEKIFAKEKVSGSEVVFVGDADFDRNAAAAFDCFFIGIRNDFNGWTENEEFVTVASVRDVAEIIEQTRFR